jgi:hypothetical protein
MAQDQIDPNFEKWLQLAQLDAEHPKTAKRYRQKMPPTC